jgi:hypothetical protein
VENDRFLEEKVELLAQASVEPKAPKVDKGDHYHYTPSKEVEWQPLLPPTKLIAAVPRLQRDIKEMADMFDQELLAQVLLQSL